MRFGVGATHFSCRVVVLRFGVFARSDQTMHNAIVQLAFDAREAGYGRESAPGDE